MDAPCTRYCVVRAYVVPVTTYVSCLVSEVRCITTSRAEGQVLFVIYPERFRLACRRPRLCC